MMDSAWRGWLAVLRVCERLALAMVLVSLAGCSKTPYDIVPIHGKVSYKDGSLIPAGSVFLGFHPQVDPLKPNVHARPGIAVPTESWPPGSASTPPPTRKRFPPESSNWAFAK